MGRATEVSKEEIAVFKVLRSLHWSDRQIGVYTGRDHRSVARCLQRENMPKKHRPGRPTKLTAADCRLIIRESSNARISAKQLKAIVGDKCCETTILKVLHSSGILRYQKMNCKPKISKRHIEARLRFAKQHETDNVEQWNHWIFSDEKKFNLDGPDGLAYYWHDLRKENKFFSTRQNGGGSVMVWAGFWWTGRTEIFFCDKNFNSAAYQTMLTNVLLPVADQIAVPPVIFQQDNAPVHVSKSTNEFLQSKTIATTHWPARSPDLNPIENLWGILVRAVYRDGRQFQHVQELKDAISKEWRSIKTELLQDLISSMPERIKAVVTSKGKETRY